jgi:hypothetical protein
MSVFNEWETHADLHVVDGTGVTQTKFDELVISEDALNALRCIANILTISSFSLKLEDSENLSGFAR